MAPQNINNYYFNKLDARLDFSSYYDFFLASDEKDFNWDVVYSNNIIGYDEDAASCSSDRTPTGCSNLLPVWFDVNSTGTTRPAQTIFILECYSAATSPQPTNNNATIAYQNDIREPSVDVGNTLYPDLNLVSLACTYEQKLFGATTGTCYSIEETTGSVMGCLIGHFSAHTPIYGMSFDDSGILYGVGDNHFYTINITNTTTAPLTAMTTFQYSAGTCDETGKGWESCNGVTGYTSYPGPFYQGPDNTGLCYAPVDEVFYAISKGGVYKKEFGHNLTMVSATTLSFTDAEITNLSYVPGQQVQIYKKTEPSIVMTGTVLTYSATYGKISIGMTYATELNAYNNWFIDLVSNDVVGDGDYLYNYLYKILKPGSCYTDGNSGHTCSSTTGQTSFVKVGSTGLYNIHGLVDVQNKLYAYVNDDSGAGGQSVYKVNKSTGAVTLYKDSFPNTDNRKINAVTHYQDAEKLYPALCNQYDTGNTIVSLLHWCKSTTGCTCNNYDGYGNYTGTTFIIPDVGLTGIDNGLTDKLTGYTLTIHEDLLTNNTLYHAGNPNNLKHDPLNYDSRLKLHPVTASTFYTKSNKSYNITSSADSTGDYYKLDGGFFQGFFKLEGYPYEVLPIRPKLGWSLETTLKVITGATTCPSTGSYLNTLYPDNKGFFAFFGTRAENKFWKPFSAETGCTTFSGYCKSTGKSGDTCSGITGQTFSYYPNCCNLRDPEVPLTPVLTGSTSTGTSSCVCMVENSPKTPIRYSAETDVWSNAIGFRLTKDYKLGYRALRYTGSCITTGTSQSCNTGSTWQCGYAIEEKYTTDPICALTAGTGILASEPWLLISIVFRRDLPLPDECLNNHGGPYDLLKDTAYVGEAYGQNHNVFSDRVLQQARGCGTGSTVCGLPPYIPSGNYFDLDCEEPGGNNYTNMVSKRWIDNKPLRNGTLYFYVNGRPVLTVENFEEIIPRPLNTQKQKQVGVPYNISWGGGSQGLYENLTISGLTGTTCDFNPPYQQDPNDLNLLIQQNFAGTWDGGISQFRYYLEPLSFDEIYHNYLVNKDRYNLVDCACDVTSGGTVVSKTCCGQGRALYLLEGDSYDIQIILAKGGNPNVNTTYNLEIDRFARFKSVVPENVLSWEIKLNGVTTNTPFNVQPNDAIQIIIGRIDINYIAKLTLIGNIIR